MKSIQLHSLALLSIVGASLCSPAAAQGPGQGAGRGRGAGGGPGGFQEAIHTLFANHTKIKRTVELTKTGYKARTLSDDPVIASTLQKHVREMRERLGSGLMIRRWDPAFAELVEHYAEIDHEFKEVEGGVEMIATGTTPEAVKVIQNHARIVSGFVDKGPAQMHKSHARALDKSSAPTEAPDGSRADAACPKCPPTADQADAKPLEHTADSGSPDTSADSPVECCKARQPAAKESPAPAEPRK